MLIGHDDFFYLIWSIQIMAESLPISSSGHIAIFNCLASKFSVKYSIPARDTDHLMHIPSLCIILAFLFTSYMNNDICRTNFLFTNFDSLNILKIFFCVVIANLVTVIFYFFITEKIKKNFPLWVGFGITSLMLCMLKTNSGGMRTDITYFDALIIGLFQSVALLPGISRLASTIFAGCYLGLSPLFSFFFSLVIEGPLICGAVAKVYLKHGLNFKSLLPKINGKRLFFLLTACLISYLLLYFMVYLINANLLYCFGWYMALLTILAISC